MYKNSDLTPQLYLKPATDQVYEKKKHNRRKKNNCDVQHMSLSLLRLRTRPVVELTSLRLSQEYGLTRAYLAREASTM